MEQRGTRHRPSQLLAPNLQLAGRFQTRFDANRNEYSIESSRGRQLLFETVQGKAARFNWRAYGQAVGTVWKKAFAPQEEGLTAYLFESEMAKALELAQADFTAAPPGTLRPA